MKYDLAAPVTAGLTAGVVMIIVFSLYSINQASLYQKPSIAGVGIPVAQVHSHLVAIAMNLSGIKDWSPTGWRYLGTDVLYEPNGTAHGIVHLELPPSIPAPQNCTNGWFATVEINIQTLEVESADYPAIGHANCDGLSFGGPIESNK